MVNSAALAADLFKSFPAEPVLFLQSSEVLGRHWLPPFSGFSAGPGSVLSRAWALVALAYFRAVALSVGFFAMAPNVGLTTIVVYPRQ